mmetsp:Transcript_29513/g.64463  ORF Transcript_29513/g.64463 Transcript_29513/m.64463 type:complete len:232 (-) Transcript_29513:62-757(-)
MPLGRSKSLGSDLGSTEPNFYSEISHSIRMHTAEVRKKLDEVRMKLASKSPSKAPKKKRWEDDDPLEPDKPKQSGASYRLYGGILFVVVCIILAILAVLVSIRASTFADGDLISTRGDESNEPGASNAADSLTNDGSIKGGKHSRKAAVVADAVNDTATVAGSQDESEAAGDSETASESSAAAISGALTNSAEISNTTGVANATVIPVSEEEPDDNIVKLFEANQAEGNLD